MNKKRRKKIQILTNYNYQLLHIFVNVQEMLKEEFHKFEMGYKPDYEHGIPSAYPMYFQLNGARIGIADLLLLLGKFCVGNTHYAMVRATGKYQLSDPIGWKISEVIAYEKLLSSLPGPSVLPSRPEEIEDWLNEEVKNEEK